MRTSHSKYYILAGSTSRDDRESVLKQGDTFAVFDRFGDVRGEHGIFHEDTRFVSCWGLKLETATPLLLSSSTEATGTAMTANLTNPDMELESGASLPRGTLHFVRTKFLWNGACHERLQVLHYGAESLSIKLRIAFEADFSDIFEVRGTERPSRGRVLAPVREGNSILVRYESLDRSPRLMRLVCSEAPAQTRRHEIEFKLDLSPGHERTLYFCLSCESGVLRQPFSIHRASHERAESELLAALQKMQAHASTISTSSARFNDFIQRAMSDMKMLVTDTKEGPYPYAGVPWCSTPFGRNGILAALEVLWLDPSLARGVLRFLSATQATAVDAATLAEPGKILHETRRSEMSNLGEVPFGCFYGSIDATPLYVMLAGAYYQATADRALMQELWPHIDAALRWVETLGDKDGDGLIEYERDADNPLHQGWRDSRDAIFHADGSDAEGPIALCEVQGYAFAAYVEGARIARVLCQVERAEGLDRLAEGLRVRFEDTFWCEELGTYALALDGQKRPCRVRTSNAGHALFAGIVSKDRAQRLAQTLFEPHSFSGWGLRTLGQGEARYNPMGYHTGAIWPHDNALLGAGLSAYGFQAEALRILLGLYESTLHTSSMRLPELFCGFERASGQAPTIYPSAGSPQAWTAGAPLLLLKACLGLTIDAPNRRVQFVRPVLPPFLKELSIYRLRVGDSLVDLELHRYPADVGINVLNRTGPIEIVNIK